MKYAVVLYSVAFVIMFAVGWIELRRAARKLKDAKSENAVASIIHEYEVIMAYYVIGCFIFLGYMALHLLKGWPYD